MPGCWRCTGVVLILGWAAALPASLHAGENERLEAYFKKYLTELFHHKPLEATRLGDHRFDHLLEDLSPAARRRWQEQVRHFLEELPQQVSYARLSRAAQIDYEIFAHHLKYTLWLMANTHPFEEDPRIYNDYTTESIYLLFTQSTCPPETNLRHALARLRQVPRVLEQARRNLTRPPRVLVETAIRQNQGAIHFYEEEVYRLAGLPAAQEDLKKAVAPVLRALREHQKFLQEDLLSRADGDWRLGPEKFKQKLALELNAGLSTGEVLHEAEAELVRVRAEMYVLARQLWSRYFPERPLPPDDDAGRQQTIRLVLARTSQEHGRVEDLLPQIQDAAASLKKFLSSHRLVPLPHPDRCRIRLMPEFQRGNTVAYLNPAPPLDPQAASYFAFSPPPDSWPAARIETFLQEYNRHMIHILTIHEAYPGHYVQLEYANKHPSLIRRVLSSGVFAEGWAVYVEQMMLDQGYGAGDLVLRLQQLKWYLRSVANAILDYKMHCGEWSDAEALRFLMEQAFQSEAEALLKILRAKQSSCQLSTYFVGRTAFVRLRRQVQRALGERFDLEQYHQAVLAQGTLPVRYLPELVLAQLRPQ
jgi:uncharacterized protein (DUF885 family)